jgi:opacity protein-like surface antigen
MSMKSSPIGIRSIFMVVLVLTFLIPINVFAKSPFYITFKPGIYSPQSSDLDDTGFNGEIAFGYRFNRNIAAEFGIGYFYSEGEDTVEGATYVRREEFDIDVYPVTFTIKAILPYKKWEFFGLAGGGAYIVYGPYDVDDYDCYCGYYCYCDYDYDYDVVWGGYLGAGIHYNITRNLFVGVEGKYLWTDNVKFDDLGVKFRMDGIIATAVIGIRF